MMGDYAERNLDANDSVQDKASFSLAGLIPGTIFMGLLLFIDLIALSSSGNKGFFGFAGGVFQMVLLWLVIGFFVVGIPYLRIKSTELVVTKKKLIGKTGFPFARAVDVYLERVDSFMVVHSLFGKIFGYATVSVRSNTGAFRFAYVKDAVRFKNTVMSCYEKRDLERMEIQAEAIATLLGGKSLAGPIKPPELIDPPGRRGAGGGGNVGGGNIGDEDDPNETTVPVGLLLGLSGTLKGQEIKIQLHEQITIGRNPDKAGYVLNNPKVSGLHMTIAFEGSNYHVTDHSSYGVAARSSGGITVKLKKGELSIIPRGSELLFADSEVIRLK